MSYKHVIITEFGGPEVLEVVEENALPEPGAGEARVKILAASATFTDTMVRKGVYYGFKETPPLSPGPAEAVSMVLSYVTAYQMLHRIAKVKRGQKILAHGAGGAVGTALLELGRLFDLEMYGTASKSKHELVKSLGGIPIDYKSEDFLAKMQAVGGVDAAFDAISGENFKRSFKSLKKGGALVPYGFYNQAMGKGGNVALDYMSVMLWNILPNGRKASFYSIGDLRKKNPEWFKEDLGALFDLLKEGKIKPAIERRMKLEDAAQAHKLIEQAAVKGRIVLMVNE
ncbi:MAG: oxidoreductase [Anaerolineaceae bacterium 4572_5.2]|nr:MAG: oxidoreductase [Anaerolineaceae bacterium 4572_5.2]